MEHDVRARLAVVGMIELRTIARAFGVQPHFFPRPGELTWLRKETVLQRIIDKAAQAHSWGALQEILDAQANAPQAVEETAPEEEEEEGGDDAQALARLLRKLSAGTIDADAVRKIVKEEVGAARRAPVEVTLRKSPDFVPDDAETCHKTFPELLECLDEGLNVLLVGPAGSGKTHAAEQAAKKLGLPFHFNGAIDSEHKLLGFVDAHGKIVPTPFRKAIVGGGVYLFDELDASSPNPLLAFCAALGNAFCDFPGEEEPVRRHADCRIIAAANTFGDGPDAKYVGRLKLDKAFLDRFVKISWGYDEDLERAIAGDDKWTDYVQTLRHKVDAQGLQIVVSPRTSIRGAKLLRRGWDKARVVERLILTGMSESDRVALGFPCK